MYRMTLTQIECIDTTSGWGDDDTAIHVNGRLIWGPTEMGDDDRFQIDYSENFEESIRVEVLEYDTGSDHDLIGTVGIVGREAKGKGVQSWKLTGDGSLYKLWGKVE